MSARLFVTGTDTGVGKTAVSAALLEAARLRGLPVRGIKPVETGCRRTGDGLVAADARELARAGGHEPLCLHRYEPPVAPARAAALAGEHIEVAELVRHVEANEGDGLCVVEGAGGLLVPLSEKATMADLAAALGAPVLIVAREQLGTINHCLLTIEALRHRGLPIHGVVLSSQGPDWSRDEDNASQIEGRGEVTVWRLPFGSAPERVRGVEPVLAALVPGLGSDLGTPPS